MIKLVNVIVTAAEMTISRQLGIFYENTLRIKNYRNLLGLLPQLPNVGRLCWRLWRDHRVPKSLKGMIIAVILYVLSPIDLVPGFFVPLVGQLDDATLLMLASYLFIRWSPQEVVSEHMASISTNFLANFGRGCHDMSRDAFHSQFYPLWHKGLVNLCPNERHTNRAMPPPASAAEGEPNAWHILQLVVVMAGVATTALGLAVWQGGTSIT